MLLALENQNRVRMLRRLRHSYSDLIGQSLQGAAWLELDLTFKPDAVQNAASLLLRMPNRTEQSLPVGASIAEAYDKAEHELLILGEPGSGKSTLLLDLAQKLVLRAEQDEAHPSPVIFPLSSWAVKRLPLQNWIVEQLAEIYDVPHQLSVEWVQEGRILPLLDGLDEMEEDARPACITAINAYHHDHMASLVICSRTAEYEAAAVRHRLVLQAAVVVQLLTHEHVDTYLTQAGKRLAALRSSLKKNSALYDLATIPLMLSILILTYQGTSVRGLSSKQPRLLQQVWDDYIRQMAERKGDNKRYPLSQTRSWLGWLARQMRDHSQTVFYLEHLQPAWLLSYQQSTYAWLAVRLPAVVIGALISIIVQLFFSGDSDLSSLLQYGFVGGVLGGLWREPMLEKDRGQGHRFVWRQRLMVPFAISVCIGLVYGLSFGFPFGPDTIRVWQIDGLPYGAMIGLSSLCLHCVRPVRFYPSTSLGSTTSWGWKQIAHFGSVLLGPGVWLVAIITGLSNALGFGISRIEAFGPSFFLSVKLLSAKSSDPRSLGWIIGLSTGMSIGLSHALVLGLNFGLTYVLINLTLNAQMGDVRLTEYLRWTGRSLRESLFNSTHLLTTLLLAGFSVIFVSISNGLAYGLVMGLVDGLIFKPISLQLHF